MCETSLLRFDRIGLHHRDFDRRGAASNCTPILWILILSSLGVRIDA